MEGRDIRLRLARTDDDSFLYDLYALTRLEELEALGPGTEQRKTFLDLQFRAQRQQYAHSFPDARHQIIQQDSRAIGRLLTAEFPAERRIVDLSLLPEFRGRGIGSRLIEDLKQTAAGEGRCLSLHVAKTNPARRLYERLGFSPMGGDEVYLRMEWRPAAGTTRG